MLFDTTKKMICEYCGKEKEIDVDDFHRYLNAFDGHFFCNGTCYKNYKHQIKIQCATCGKQVMGHSKNISALRRKNGATIYFCSEECKLDMFPKRNPTITLTLVCPVCGRIYERSLANFTWAYEKGQETFSCSPECAHIIQDSRPHKPNRSFVDRY